MKDKTKNILLSLLIVFLFSFGIINIIYTNSGNNDIVDTIKIGNYGYIPEKDKFIKIVNEKWKELGHDSKLIFEDYECYDELPKEDYDLFIYDGLVYKSLRENDLLEDLDIDTSYSFSWANNLFESDNLVYGVPLFLCSDFLIYNKDLIDYSDVNSIKDIDTSFTTQYKSMVLNYYLSIILRSIDNNILLDLDSGIYNEDILNSLYYLASKMDIDDYINSTSSTYVGKEKMNNKEFTSLFGFSESLYYLNDIINSIDIKDISLMDSENNNKSYYVDYISIRKGASSNEEELYIELLNLIISEEVNYEYSFNDGKYLYIMSANKNVLNRLSNDNKIYNKLYNYALKDSNRVVLYSNEYYQEFDNIKSDLKSIIDSRILNGGNE